MLKEKHVFIKKTLCAMSCAAMYLVENLLILFGVKMHESGIMIVASMDPRILFFHSINPFRITVVDLAVWQYRLNTIYIIQSDKIMKIKKMLDLSIKIEILVRKMLCNFSPCINVSLREKVAARMNPNNLNIRP